MRERAQQLRWMGTRLSKTIAGFALMATLIGMPIYSIADEPTPKAPPLPEIQSISIEPASLILEDRRDQRTVIVTGHTATGQSVDLSGIAHLTPSSNLVSIGADSYIHPQRAGKTEIIVSAAGRQARLPVQVVSVAAKPISFVREVMPVLSRSGCNAGTCHGSAKGKNGFKLSLRGYDPDYDYHALIDDVDGRRFNRSAPSQSLMLLKPTGTVPHKGGVVFKPGSPAYDLLLQWIAEGVRSDAGVTRRVARLEVLPSVPNVTLPGMTQKTIVIAHYPEGDTRDVTRDAVCTSSLPEVALVSPAGQIEAIRRGEAAMLVRYEGTYAANNVLVLGDRTGYKWHSEPELGYIDRLVDLKLRKIKAIPSGLCDDATYMRRVYLDLTGLPPLPDKTRAFLADKTETKLKRTKLVDSLLDSPEYIDRWTNKWADLLDVNSKYLGDSGMYKFRNWIHSAVAHNMPYDVFVRNLMTASGDAFKNPPANYLRIARDTSTATENVTQLFLGVRFSCAKCHDHPFERWTQTQYYQLGAFFAQVGYKPGSESNDEVVYNSGVGEVMHPKTGLAVAPAVPVGKLMTANLTDRRDEFADWLVSPRNPFFSRSMANRLWSYFLGRGIIDPVDDVRASNPASNPELLEALNKDFVQSGFDLKHMMRVICLSRVYQQSIDTNRWNSDDKVNFSHFIPRRLEAEQLLDSIRVVTGTDSRFSGLPLGMHAEQIPDATTAGGDGFLDLFGKPARQTPCECERSSSVSLGQALNLINGPTLSDAVAAPTGRLAAFLKTNPSETGVVDEVFMTVFARKPTAKEISGALKITKGAASQAEGAQDLMWALLNSPAFLFNR